MVDTSAVAHAAMSIASFLAEEGKYLYGAENRVRDLQRDLNCMHKLLEDVDASPHMTRQDGRLHNFTQEIRELAIRAEDAIDTYIVNVEDKIHGLNPFTKFTSIISHSYSIHTLIKEIEAIQQGIQKASDRFQTFGIIPSTTFQQQSNIGSSSQPILERYMHLDDQVVVGIDDDIAKLVHCLTNPEDDFKVLAILGTGGAGKTTLASKIYRHHKVASWFSLKAFVSVSQKWSRIDLLHSIFKQIKRGSGIPSSESDLIEELYDFLKDNRWLMVLDDVWRRKAWDDVYPILSGINKGCRVILTTQIEEVSLYADSKCIIHKPQLLTKDQKWELFNKVAIEGRVHIENKIEFAMLGKQMLGKCGGLPLEVVTLAGILRTKPELYQWENISKAHTEYVLQERGAPNYGVVEDMLELSYLDLPSYLKSCFLYLAIFPKDYIVLARDLIQMFIAEGFITNVMIKGEENLEDAAMRSVDELAQRCIFRVISRNALGQIDKLALHDLIRELCIQKAKECQFVGTVSSTYPNVGGLIQSRRISIFSREYTPVENHHLRTLNYFGEPKYWPDGVIRNLESLHEKFKLLRVLKIWGITNVALPEQIGSLIHLTYLGIINTNIRKLPKSTRNLRNLLYIQYFWIITPIGELVEVEVPNNLVCNMESLIGCVLPSDLKRGLWFNRMLGLSGSKNLKALSSGAGAWMIKELPILSTTVQNLQIHHIQKKEEMEAIYQCPSIKEDRLCRLTCYFRLHSAELEFDLQKLRDCRTLWRLKLDGPLANNWTGTIQFPPNLVKLRLCDSRIKERGDLMQVLGELSKLKSLSLSWDAYLGKQLNCSSSAFPQLQKLKLSFLYKLEEWGMEEGAMARLSKLKIESCEKLKRLPKSIRFITTLKELEITNMPTEFRRRVKHEGSSEGEDFYIVQHIPSVIFNVGSK